MHIRPVLLGFAALLSLPSGLGAAGKAGQPVPIVDDNGALTRYFQALKRAEAGQGVARAVHYGDSTLGADGIARTVRDRLSARFGDAGPGFVSGGVDDVRVSRADVAIDRDGAWRSRSILLGGADGRYGLGGAVGIASAGASAKVGPEASAGPYRKVELWFQAGQGYGSLWAAADGVEIMAGPALAELTEDRWFSTEVPGGFTTLKLGASGGAVPWYGVVLETGEPGTTWETQSVIGVGSKSFRAFSAEHLTAQLGRRDPDLVVLQIGGNEAGFPVLQYGDGSDYLPIYQGALGLLRAAAPDASCLVVTPLDQGDVATEEAPATAKRAMPRMVAAQRRAAAEAGCAFWSAFDAMGGSGSILTWASARPQLAWSDLLHLSPAGLGIIGGHLSDALLGAYDAWNTPG